MTDFPLLGYGVGLRPTHYSYVLEQRPKVDFFEAITENYLDTQGRPLEMLKLVANSYPIFLHGVSMSICSDEKLDATYLKKLKNLIDIVQPAIVSDHLCWTGLGGKNTHDLLPIPYTKEAVDCAVRRITQVQEYLGRSILVENVSSYVSFSDSTMTEWQFVNEVSTRSGCGILLDVNNVYVNAFNSGMNAYEFIREIKKERVAQIHLAGHTNHGTYLFDTHDSHVIDPVWDLYEHAVRVCGNTNTMIEWDDQIPTFPVLMQELEKAKLRATKVERAA